MVEINKKLTRKNLTKTDLTFLLKGSTLFICALAKLIPIVTTITDPAHFLLILYFVLVRTKLTNKLFTFLDFRTSYLGSLRHQIATDIDNTTMAYQKK